MAVGGEMKLEAGKFYKTRDGRKARIYATDGNVSRPIHGAIFENNYAWYAATWRSDGTEFLKPEIGEMDLVEEWKEPLVVEFEDMAISNGWTLRDDDAVFICNNALNAFAGKRVKVRVEEIL